MDHLPRNPGTAKLKRFIPIETGPAAGPNRPPHRSPGGAESAHRNPVEPTTCEPASACSRRSAIARCESTATTSSEAASRRSKPHDRRHHLPVATGNTVTNPARPRKWQFRVLARIQITPPPLWTTNSRSVATGAASTYRKLWKSSFSTLTPGPGRLPHPCAEQYSRWRAWGRAAFVVLSLHPPWRVSPSSPVSSPSSWCR